MPTERSELYTCNLTPFHRRDKLLKAIKTIGACITKGVYYNPIRIQGEFVNLIDDSGYELCLRMKENFEV